MTVTNPFDGSSYQMKDDIDFAKLNEMNGECQSSKAYERWIKELDIGTTMKATLIKLNEAVIHVGKVTFKIGKILLNVIMEIAKQFPNTIMGLVVGFTLGLLFSSIIPFLGWLLSPIVIPFFTIYGGIKGFMADMQNKINSATTIGDIRKMVDEKLAKFSELKLA
jgi:hypothetical protein